MITIFIIIIIIAFIIIIIIIIIIINIPIKSFQRLLSSNVKLLPLVIYEKKDEHRETDDLCLKMNWRSILLEFF